MTHTWWLSRERATRLVILALSLTLVLGLLDRWLYHHTIAWMEQKVATLQETSHAHGVTLSIVRTTPHGWPFGAQLSLSHVQLLTKDGTLQSGGATSSLEFGGTWAHWAWALLHNTAPPLHSDGESIFRLLYHDKDLTFYVHQMRLFPSLDHTDGSQSFTLRADRVRFSAEFMPLSGALNTLSGRLYWKNHASPEQSAFATALNAQQLFLTQPNLSLHHPVTHLHFTAALPGCFPTLQQSLSQGCTLRLHDLSADVPFSSPPSVVHLSLAGRVSVPDGNGALTVQLTHWRDSFLKLLDTPVTQQRMSPDMVSMLQHAFVPPSSSPALAPERPLSMTLSLSHALPTGLTNEKLRMLYRLLSRTP